MDEGAAALLAGGFRCYDYVKHPYERVRETLRQHALTVFQSATKAAAYRAQSIAAELHVDVGGIGVKTDIKISVKSVEENVLAAISSPATPVAARMGSRDQTTLVSA